MVENYNKNTCIHCGEILSVSHVGLCQTCGKVGKKSSITGEGGAIAGGTALISTKRSFYEKNKKACLILIVITIGSPFLGLFIIGIPGLIIGLILSIMSYFLGSKAIMKVVEFRHYN